MDTQGLNCNCCCSHGKCHGPNCPCTLAGYIYNCKCCGCPVNDPNILCEHCVSHKLNQSNLIHKKSMTCMCSCHANVSVSTY
ncbi:hypothetical protein U3516DRAFT_789142 [Neocallimastix sp. 'constans']